MNDPHVERLHYVFTHADEISYTDPLPVSADQDGFRLVLDRNELTVEMVEHHATEESAREAVEPFLRSWELHDAIAGTGARMKFVFKFADVMDRSPTNDRSVVLKVHNSSHAHVVDSVTLRVNYRQYPSPPRGFLVTPDVDVMWLRYEGYLAGREPLASMAYFCLTVLETSAGGRSKAAQRYRVEIKVLEKVGELSSTRGDAVSARKAGAVGNPVTESERRWLEAALRRLIARVAESAGGRNVDVLRMAELPPL